MEQQFIDFVKQHVTVEESALTLILAAFKPKSIKRNQNLLSVGEVCNEFYYIIRGGVRVYFLTQQGQEKTRFITLDNTIITSLSSFISQKSSLETIEALEDTDVLAISHNDFYSLVKTCRDWEIFYRFILETAYMVQTQRIEMRITLSAKQRFDLVMKNNPEFLQRLSNRVLASYLDITQETLSRLKSK